jgi:hypothetical protein
MRQAMRAVHPASHIKPTVTTTAQPIRRRWNARRAEPIAVRRVFATAGREQVMMRPVFDFLRRRRQATLIAKLETALIEAESVRPMFGDSRENIQRRATLLEQARVADLADEPIVRRLDFLQRLFRGLATSIPDDGVPALLNEAATLNLADNPCVGHLRDHQRLQDVKTHGPAPTATDPRGRVVYLKVPADYKNKPGELQVRDDGLTFTGDVVVEIAWAEVSHVARTTHRSGGYDADAIAVQEGKRRSGTKFAFHSDADVVCETILQVWQRRGSTASQT